MIAILLGLLALSRAANPQSTSSDLEARAKAALSQLRGTERVKGLERPVQVLRDRWGVPHIYAENGHDLFFAQGYVAAQDRLFQMELWKRAGQGRLAEVLGPSALLRDLFARRLRYRGPPDAEYSSYAPDVREILESFTGGINAFLEGRGGSGQPPLPLEFQLAGFVPEPWKPEDCLSRMAAISVTGNFARELEHAVLVGRIGAERAARLLDLDPPVALDPAPGLDYSGLSPDLLRELVGSDARLDLPAAPAGSNNWVVSGKLTDSGHPFLANDPHRSIALPSLRYLVHLSAPGWDVIGAGEPALPGVAVGHNRRIAWGFTVFGIDQQDLYVEELDPSDANRCATETGWEAMRVEKEEIRVRGGQKLDVLVKLTRHGPVVWEDGRRALVLKWVGAEPGTAPYLGSLALDRAAGWTDFLAAMERWKVPSENIVYADADGNIGELSAGLAPIRKNWTGLLPVPGRGGFEWAGFVPTSRLPRVWNPSSGFIATANHKMIPDGYPFAIGFQWAAPYRFDRIVEVLREGTRSGQRLSFGGMQLLQGDILSTLARELRRLLASASRGAADVPTKLLLSWNASLERDSAAAALYELWVPEVRRQVARRLAPREVWSLVEDSLAPQVWMRALREPRAEVFGPRAAEERDRLLRETLVAAGEKTRSLLGEDPARWSWGSLHAIRFRHPLGRTAGAESLFNLPAAPRPGDGTTVNATAFASSSFEQRAGASFREILDPFDWDRSVAVNAPGQSGQPSSPHYADLAPLWAETRYFPLLFSRAAVERETVDRLVLEPGRPRSAGDGGRSRR